VTDLAFDLFSGARGWEADLDEGDDLRTIGFELDPDACATARAAGLHSVQDDVARLVPDVVALVYGQPDGIIASPPCQLFSAAGKGTGRQIMEELHRAVSDAARGVSDVEMARHRRELRRLLYKHLRETEGVGAPARYPARKRPRASRYRKPDGKPYAREATPIRRGELRAEADRMARNVSLVWQPARWVAALRPRWVALEQVPAVLPLWEAMARALEVHGYRCWTGVLSSECYGVPQTRKRAILLASLDHQPQPPEATHQAYVPGEPARQGDPDLFGPGLKPWRSMAEALGWGMTERPTHTVTTGGTGSGGGVETFGGGDVRRIIERERERGAWLATTDPGDIEVEIKRSKGSGGRRARKGTEPAPTIRGGAGGGCGPNLEVRLADVETAWVVVDTGNTCGGTRPDGRGRAASDPAVVITSRADQLERRNPTADAVVEYRRSGERLVESTPVSAVAPAVTSRVDRWQIKEPTHYDSRQQRDMRTGEPRFVRQRTVQEPAPTIASESRNDAWVSSRPATTVNGDARISQPGHHDPNMSGSQQANAVRVSVQEAAVLQSFPADWPLHGVQTSQFQQIGNAIPPLFARAILAAVTPTVRSTR